MLIIQLLVLACLGIICYQDMKYRAVYWICFPILAGLLLYLKQYDIPLKDSLWESSYGLFFFGIQLVLLWLYFSVKHRKPVNMTTHYLGLGDILFLLAVAFYLSPVNYILFYVGSLIVVLMATLLLRVFNKTENPEIPLAGLQALMLAIVLLFSMCKPDLKPYTDNWIYGF